MTDGSPINNPVRNWQEEFLGYAGHVHPRGCCKEAGDSELLVDIDEEDVLAIRGFFIHYKRAAAPVEGT